MLLQSFAAIWCEHRLVLWSSAAIHLCLSLCAVLYAADQGRSLMHSSDSLHNWVASYPFRFHFHVVHSLLHLL